MSQKLGQIVESVLQAFYSQERRDNTEWNEYNVIPFVYSARDKLLHQLLLTGQVGRNYGSGQAGQLGADGYTIKSMTVVESDGIWSFQITTEYADLKDNAGVVVVPLAGTTNPFRQVAYGYQWSGMEFLNMEGNTAYWVDPNRNVVFAKNPNATQVGMLIVESIPDPGEYDLDADLKFPAHLGFDIIAETVMLMGRPRPADNSNNNNDQQPGR